MDTLKTLADGILKTLRSSPRPEHMKAALERVVQRGLYTEMLRAYQWKDNSELGRLIAHEIDNELMRIADAEARKLGATMGVTA
jgi:hypothetical protein